jgi:hypothetical protein
MNVNKHIARKRLPDSKGENDLQETSEHIDAKRNTTLMLAVFYPRLFQTIPGDLLKIE